VASCAGLREGSSLAAGPAISYSVLKWPTPGRAGPQRTAGQRQREVLGSCWKCKAHRDCPCTLLLSQVCCRYCATHQYFTTATMHSVQVSGICCCCCRVRTCCVCCPQEGGQAGCVKVSLGGSSGLKQLAPHPAAQHNARSSW
jgi:hypothetical protein